MGPQSRNSCVAVWAGTVASNVVFLDDVAASSNEAVITVWTEGVLIVAYLPRQIASIDKA